MLKTEEPPPLPTFLNLVKEITDDETYLSRNLSKLDFKMSDEDKKISDFAPPVLTNSYYHNRTSQLNNQNSASMFSK
jgi:hypothetical protein